jgi:hypothetical protein
MTCIVAGALPVHAAEITRIATSFEPDDPFGLYLGAGYVRDQRKSRIVRERHQEGDLREVNELNWLQVENRLDLDLRVGLWVDLEFRFTLPVVFSRDQTWDYAFGNGPERSTITTNCVQADGEQFDPTCAQTGAGQTPIFEVPNASYRGGLGNMRFGLSYALFNERKDPSKPMWILGVDYEAPTAALHDPSAPTAPDARGGVGDRHHRYTFFTAFSKRRGVADPYFKIHYTLPYRGPGWYSNCDNPDPRNMSVPENCGQGFWSRSRTGTVAPHTGGIIFGSEFVPWETGPHQKLALDLRVITRYVGPGRYYNPLSDVLGKTLQTSDYLEVGGAAGLTAWAAEYLGFSVLGTLTYATDHTLTGEKIGEDLTGPQGQPDGAVNLDRREELNPNFDHRVDMISRRFRATETYNWRIDVKATFNF